MHDYEERDARDGIPAPALGGGVRAGEEQPREDHDGVGEQGDEDVAAVETRDEGQREQDQRGGQRPVDPTDPEDLAEDVQDGVGDVVLVALDDHVVDEGEAAAGGLGEVGEGSDGGDEGDEEVEEAFLLGEVRGEMLRSGKGGAYSWDLPG